MAADEWQLISEWKSSKTMETSMAADDWQSASGS